MPGSARNSSWAWNRSACPSTTGALCRSRGSGSCGVPILRLPPGPPEATTTNDGAGSSAQAKSAAPMKPDGAIG